jgi:hypothetical protein
MAEVRNHPGSIEITGEADPRVVTAHRMIDFYNDHDADGYVALMTENACEAMYRGDVLRDGREGIRIGLKAMFAQYPKNRADILATHLLGETVVLHEKVVRDPNGEQFYVLSIYSFSGDKVERVEFIR